MIKLYTSAVKYNDQLQFKDIIEASMVYTPVIFTDNIPMSPGYPMIVKKCSARKFLHLFTEFFDFKTKSAVSRVGDAKSKRKEIRADSMLWSSIPKRGGHEKINERVKKSLYNWILQHSQVVQSTI